jgi:benzodiazapine receptor
MDRYLPVGITLLTILSNSLGGNIKEISNKYNINPTDNFTPAPYTFSIWGIIYSFLLYTTFKNYDQILNTQTPYGSIFTLFVISSILNALWIQAWGKNLLVSSVLLILLASILMLITVELNKANVDKILIYTFGLYTAWAVVAALLNLSTLLINGKILDNKIMKYIIVGILTVLPFLIKDIFKKILDKSIIPMLLVFIWASLGIVLNGNNNLIFIGPIITSALNIFL